MKNKFKLILSICSGFVVLAALTGLESPVMAEQIGSKLRTFPSNLSPEL